MNQPYTPFEPQIGEGPKADEKPTIGTETTNPTINFESGKTHTGSAIEEVKTAARAKADKYRGKAEQALGDAQERVQSFQKRDRRRGSPESNKSHLYCVWHWIFARPDFSTALGPTA
jgi:uncharacterized protein YjbJ (UPF0337 family)